MSPAGITTPDASATSVNTPPPTQAIGISPNDAVAGTAGAITDASGKTWTITPGGQVAVNGTADPTTANVIELAYVNGTVWQENASKLWWGKSSPSASWSPAPGTAISPLPATSAALRLGTASHPLKVMPMGDSMTASGGTAYNGGPPPGGYRAPLYASLTSAGFTIQYVGDQTTNPGGGLPANQDNHEGIGGYSIETVDNSTTSPGLLNYIQDHNILRIYQPDVILLDIGYNNIYTAAPENVGPAQAFAFLQQMIGYIFQQLPSVRLLVGTVPATSGDPGIPTSDPNSPSALGYYNYLVLNKLAPAINNPNLSIVDINGAENAYAGSGGVASLIGPDGIHPSVTGFQIMAQAWQTGLERLTSASGTGTAPPPAGPSANDTVINAGSPAAITDASGNTWTITAGGQVAVNGTTDPTTANVTELAYVNGTVWQKNASNLWWSKTAPETSWLPTPGTPTSPLPGTGSITPGSITQSQTATTVSLSQVNLYAGASSRMLFVTGTGDTITVTGGSQSGIQSITDEGGLNTYVLSPAGKGSETFTSNILTLNDTLDLHPALAATDWNHSSSILSSDLGVTSRNGAATLLVAPTAGGKAVAIATIGVVGGTTLPGLLAHALT